MGIPQGTDRMRLGPTEALRAVFAGIGRIVMAADRPQANGGRTTAEATAATDRARPNAQASGRSGRARGKAEPPSSRWRSLDETGNVRLLTADDLDDGDVLQGRAAGPDSASSLAAAAEAQTAGLAAPAGPASATTAEPAAASALAAPAEPASATTAEPDSATTAEAAATSALASPAEPASATTAEAAATSALASPAEPAPLAVDLPLASYDTLSLASIRARLRALDVGQLRMLVAYEQANAERPEVLGMLERRIEKLETGR
jgi:hypothetical protein